MGWKAEWQVSGDYAAKAALAEQSGIDVGILE